MASHPASPGPTARIRLGALLVLLPLAVGCGSGGGPVAVSHEARLADLAVSGGELVPAFSPDVHTYSLDVGGLAAGIVVSPTALGSGTVIRVQGDEVSSADASDPVPIAPGGVQAILVETTASDGVATSSYTILVLRAQLESATLEAYLKKHAHVTDALGLRYDADHHFGYAVALSGDTLVVGAPLESGSGAGVDPPVGGVSVASGAAYVFVRTAGAWAQQAYLKSPQPAPGDEFGFSVAVSGDWILVGAPYADPARGLTRAPPTSSRAPAAPGRPSRPPAPSVRSTRAITTDGAWRSRRTPPGSRSPWARRARTAATRTALRTTGHRARASCGSRPFAATSPGSPT